MLVTLVFFDFSSISNHLKCYNKAIENKADFVYEGHFPSYAAWDFPKRFKEDSYQIQMLFSGLKNVYLSEMRVGLRAKKGGHNVPRYDIENNFTVTLKC